MRGYKKPGVPGGTVVLATREVYPRETTLPLNWKRCRIGMFYSIVGLGGDNENGPTSSESIPRFGPSDQIAIGIGNGVSTCGFSGNRFVGIVSNTAVGGFSSPYVAGTYPYWRLCADVYNGAIGDGEIVATQTTGNANPTNYGVSAASNTEFFAGFFAVDIKLTGTGAIIGVAADVAPGGQPYGWTDVSKSHLLSRMIQGPAFYPATVSGGWWLTGDPIGIRHFHVRVPHVSRRLRLHAIHAMDLS